MSQDSNPYASPGYADRKQLAASRPKSMLSTIAGWFVLSDAILSVPAVAGAIAMLFMYPLAWVELGWKLCLSLLSIVAAVMLLRRRRHSATVGYVTGVLAIVGLTASSLFVFYSGTINPHIYSETYTPVRIAASYMLRLGWNVAYLLAVRGVQRLQVRTAWKSSSNVQT